MEQFDAIGLRDQLNIATPEQVELSFPVAGIGSRFVAVLLDHIFQGIAIFLFFLVVGIFFAGVQATHASSQTLDRAGKWFVAALILFFFLLWSGYFAVFEAFWHGQTPGKKIMKLRVIKETGRQITFFESLARNLLRAVDVLPSLYMVGVIVMACNRANKRVGDFAAGTIVVHELREEQPLFVAQSTTLLAAQEVPLNPWAANAEAMSVFPADAIAKLAPSDLNAVEGFFARALDLPMETRGQLAQRILRQLCAKMGVEVPGGNPERALEAIAHAMRGAARF